MKRSAILLGISLLTLCGIVQAEERSLGDVQVHAGAETQSGPGAAADYDSIAFTSVITADDLKDRKTDLPEVLEEQAGVAIKRRGGLDDFATVSIRGSTSEQVAVYVDGILLNQGQGGAVNVATIPVDQIERIEIYKGAAPARFQSSSIGGVVNIVTKKAGAGRTTTLGASYGSFNTISGTALQAQRFSTTAYQAGYTFTHSDGDFTFENDHGTPFNTADDTVDKRANNDFNRHNLFTKFEWAPVGAHGHAPLHISFNNQFFREDRGIPGLGTLTSNTANLSTTRDAVSLEFKKREIWKSLALSLIPFFQYQKQQFSDPFGEIGLGIQDNDDDTFQYGSTLLGEWLWGTHQRFTAALDYRGEQFLPEDFSNTPSSGPHSLRNTVSFALEDEIYLANECLVLNPSIRTEHIFDEQGGAPSTAHHPLSAKLGVKYLPWGAAGWLTIKSNVSRSFRIPSFSELFGDQGTFVGNPNLKPETSFNWDIGAILVKKPVRWEISYYFNSVDDLIQLLQTSQFTIQAQNLSKARIQGVETAVSADLWNHLNLSA
ncbi:MAG TPA: TonB-dependent receptor, partial [bacterium]|nr:TonB-dependent receptor [bacterium]